MLAKNSLAVKLLPLTAKVIWERGQDYANDQSVGDIWREKDKIIAHVFGTKRYLVKLTTKGQITGQCSCPYASSGEICKHMAALAIVYDKHQGLSVPNQKQVEKVAKDEPPKYVSSGSVIDELFSNPLEADLESLRTYTDFGKWVRPHAKLPPRPPMVTAKKPLTAKELEKVFEKFRSWETRSGYDSYFCAGEVTAAVCEVFRIIFSRLPKTDPEETAAIYVCCLKFHFKDYLGMIDGSDGIWQIAEAHLAHLCHLLKKQGMDKKSLLPFKKKIEKIGEGWGLSFKQLIKGDFR